MLKFALLGFLYTASMSGYDLERAMEASLQHFWPTHLSQIYRTLKQLEEAGLLTSQIQVQHGRPDKRVYTITAAGRAEFAGWRDEIVTERDPLRIPMLVRFFFSGSGDLNQTITQLRVQRQQWAQELQEIATGVPTEIDWGTASSPDASYEPVMWELTRRAGEKMLGALIEWFDESIEELSRISEHS